MNKHKPEVWRNDAIAKVTGKAKYTDDLKTHNLLHAVPVYTDHVHAKINNIYIEQANNAADVVGVITANDIRGSNRVGQIYKDYRILADDKIRFNGDVIAIVVAKNRDAAIKAAKLVTLDVEELPPILDPLSAMDESSGLVHKEHGSNIINYHKMRHGNIDAGFKEADTIIEKEFKTHFAEHAYLEPESAICIPHYDGIMFIYASTQHPFSTRRFAAAALGVKLTGVEVKSTPIGGGFGGKDDTISIIAARTAIAAQILNCPVKMTYDREWSMRESYKRHPYCVSYKIGLNSKGIIKALKIRIIADGGAYCSVSPWVTWRSTVQCGGPYVIDNVWCDAYAVYTNNVYTGAFRGFGSPQINFCIEQLLEIAAEKIGITPVAIRQLNMVHQDCTTITGQKLDAHTVSMQQVFDSIRKESGFDTKINQCTFGKGDKNELYGIGLAMSYRGMSLGAEGTDFHSAIVNVQFDGSVYLHTGIHENGQGAESVMILLLARELGISKERIHYHQPSTVNIPDGGTTVSSRGTLMGGGSVIIAAQKLKKKIAEVIATEFACPSDNICFEDEKVFDSCSKSSILDFEEAVQLVFKAQVHPHSLGTFKAPKVSWDEKKGQGNPYFTWVYGCQAIELTVNKKTGKVTLLKAYAAHDVGRAINPPMLLGQFYGGIAMGIGYALFEDLKIKEGRIENLNFNSYRIPRASDLPEMKGIIIENPDPLSPSKAKGIGEPTMELMAPAIANAIYNATGQRCLELPIKVKVNSKFGVNDEN
jgi:CO/xanthine dehydrogenase Mo-binding subunit